MKGLLRMISWLTVDDGSLSKLYLFFSFGTQKLSCFLKGIFLVKLDISKKPVQVSAASLEVDVLVEFGQDLESVSQKVGEIVTLRNEISFRVQV